MYMMKDKVDNQLVIKEILEGNFERNGGGRRLFSYFEVALRNI